MAVHRPGFVLYVALPDPDRRDEATEPDARTTRLVEAAEVLRELALDLIPAAETYTVLTTEPQRPDALLGLLADRPPV